MSAPSGAQSRTKTLTPNIFGRPPKLGTPVCVKLLDQEVQNKAHEDKQKQVAYADSPKSLCHSKWLENMLGGDFFAHCKHHLPEKNGQNMYCIDCAEALCPFCKPSHPGCRMLQVFRHVFCDVVRVDDFSRLFDIEGVQQFTVNSSKVVRLKARVASSPLKRGSGSVQFCHSCDRGMQTDCKCDYCSLDCKIKAVSKAKGSKAAKALMKECPTFSEFKIRTSSPSTTKCKPIDGDGEATLTQAPRTAKRKLDLPASPSRKAIRGARTDESEVEVPMADTYASESSRSRGTYSLEYVTPVNYSSPPRRARTNRQRVRHHHPYSPPSDASTPEVEAAQVLFGMAYIEYI